MSEDEAINILKTMCTDNFCIEQLKTKQAIETILDLYQKEKEENKELSEELTERICKTVEAEVFEEMREELKQEREKNKILEEELQKYISGEYFTEKQVKHLEMTRKMFWINKDKIREKIKKLEEKSDYWNCDEIEVLKELLEEE